ncbi:MAG TPA: M6 family metalloprotease domain-containing protein, partial [Longimicrobiales bacterium]|nr:M6 family metalloprotease domain-containing protein [Longimicrobiales bacterium]
MSGSLPRALHAQKALPFPSATGEVSPPDVIAGLRDARPSAPLEFSRAWLNKVDEVRRHRADLTATGELDGLSPWQAQQRGAALSGTLRVPIVPVVYSDVAAPFPVEALRERLFGRSRGDTLSFTAYWEEVSSGLLHVEGTVTPWIRLGNPARHYLPESAHGWAQFGRTPELRIEALRAADDSINFGEFDNDGPDGKPNSGDDDGYVDFVALVYALPCPGSARAGAIWPHRAAMPPMDTNDPSARGGTIKIADYVILPAVDPQSCGPMHIGVLAHETGHALGLPDLYDYDGSTQGIGAWGLMGTGSHSARYSPAHLSAWEKEQLGWVRISWLRQGLPISVPPVERDPEVYRYDIPNGTGEYVLLENRQRIGSDKRLPGHGLLAWRINPERGELGAWNSDERKPAVTLIEADERLDLTRGGRADATDPYPGALARQMLRLPDLQSLRLSFIRERQGVIYATPILGYTGPTLVPQRNHINLTALVGQAAAQHTIQMKQIGDVTKWTARARAKWLKVSPGDGSLDITADPWSLPPGAYQDTVYLAVNGGDISARVVVDLRVALPGIPEIVASELPWSWGLAARSGRVLQASYSWDALGLRPRPRVLQLWDGTHHPETLSRIPADALYAPAMLDDQTAYVIARARNANYLYRLDSNGGTSVVAAGFGEGPAYGATVMPDSSVVVAEWSGRLHRITPAGVVSNYALLNANIYQVAADANGVIYAASLDGDVIRLARDGTSSIITTGFGNGKLVAIALSRNGDLYVAERGDLGRILRINADGTRQHMLQSRGAQFYGLAVDDQFLYAIDMHNRQLLRIPIDAMAPASLV